jgi:hypothetical protein
VKDGRRKGLIAFYVSESLKKFKVDYRRKEST